MLAAEPGEVVSFCVALEADVSCCVAVGTGVDCCITLGITIGVALGATVCVALGTGVGCCGGGTLRAVVGIDSGRKLVQLSEAVAAAVP